MKVLMYERIRCYILPCYYLFSVGTLEDYETHCVFIYRNIASRNIVDSKFIFRGYDSLHNIKWVKLLPNVHNCHLICYKAWKWNYTIWLARRHHQVSISLYIEHETLQEVFTKLFFRSCILIMDGADVVSCEFTWLTRHVKCCSKSYRLSYI
jgi:hypothetical protein